jgi:hypothetical protein
VITDQQDAGRRRRLRWTSVAGCRFHQWVC